MVLKARYLTELFEQNQTDIRFDWSLNRIRLVYGIQSKIFDENLSAESD